LTIKKPQSATLIDTFSEGYAAINRRPGLVLLPILLNLYIWFGTQLSFAPLLDDLSRLIRMSATAAGQTDPDAEASAELRDFGPTDMRQALAGLNFIPTLNLYTVVSTDPEGRAMGFPTVQLVPPAIDSQRKDTIEVTSIPGALLALLLLNTLALPLSAVFLTHMAAVVRGDRAPLATTLQRAWRTMVAMLGWIGIVAGVVLALGLPFLFLFALLYYFATPLGVLMFVILLVLGFWIRIYLGFTNEAIVISGVGPLRALHASFNIVRRNFWATLGFVAISSLISIGSGMLWMNLVQRSTVGLLIAIVGSAYLSSGLLAARMAFYRERLRRWQSGAAPVRPL
jgi:hypothetical protein